MEMNVLAILLLGLAIISVSFASPITQCGSPSPSPSSEECYVQNNGQPVVVVANNPVEPASDSNPLNCASSQIGQSAQNSLGRSQGQSSGQFDSSSNLGSQQRASISLPSSPVSAYGGSYLSSDSSSVSSSDLQKGQNLADQAAVENSLETLPQSNTPCKVETNTEVENIGGETFVHHPGPIYINQPPTRLIINHPPFVIRPSPIVLNQAGRKVTKEYTKTYLPSQVQVRPIIVRVVKPIEQKVLVDKPSSQQSSQSCGQTSSGAQSSQSGGQPSQPSQSEQWSQRPSQPSQSVQWDQQQGQSAQSGTPCLSSLSQGSNGNSSYQDSPIDLHSDDSSDSGSSFQQGSSVDLTSVGCGCAKK